ncbi:hypothetical protein ACFX11_037915 [Malus domestica]
MGELFTDEASNATISNQGNDMVTPITSSFTRPPERDMQKEANRKWKMQDSICTTISFIFEKLTECREAWEEGTVRMRLAFEKQSEIEQERFGFDVNIEDLNKYIPNRKKLFLDKKKEIMRKDATRNIFQDGYPSHTYIPSSPLIHHQVKA